MKKILSIASVLAFLPAAAYADGPSGYVSFGTGLSITKHSYFNDGVNVGSINSRDTENFSGAVGVAYFDNLRTELEASYRRPSIDSLSFNGVAESASGRLTTWTYLVNEYYDFMEGQKFRPYISAGAGAALHKLSISSLDITQTSSNAVFAYQLGLGASYSPIKEVSFWGGYRYLGSARSSFQGLNAEYGSHEFNTGLRFNF